jgi:hypothetical protein
MGIRGGWTKLGNGSLPYIIRAINSKSKMWTGNAISVREKKPRYHILVEKTAATL